MSRINCRARVPGLRLLRMALVFVGLMWQVPGVCQEGKATPAAGKSSPEALTMYADAANYQNNGAYELAAEEWSRFVARFGEDPLAAKAQHYRGVCLQQLKQHAEAAKAFNAVISTHPEFELLEDTFLNLGWCQYSLAVAGDQERYAQAVETFRKLESTYPEGKYVDQALFFQAESLYALDKKKDAALAYGKLVTAHPESKLRCDALYAVGVTLEEMGQWQQAAKAYDMFLADCAKSDLVTEVRMRKAETILQGGDAKTAEALFAEVAAAAGFAAADHALLRQAYCAAQQDKMVEAAGLYASLSERFPNSANAPEATLSAGRCYYRAEKFVEAAQWLDKVVSADGAGAIEAAHWRCRIYLRNREFDKMLQLADKKLPAVGEDPFGPNLRLDRADALYATDGRKADALQEYVALLQSQPDHEVAPVALYNAAFAALDVKHYDQAAGLASKFLTSYPQHLLVPDVRYIVAECHLQQKEYAQAEAIYRELVETAAKHPENTFWRVRLGLVAYLQKKYQQVIDLLTPLIPQLSTPAAKAEALFLVGVSRFQLNEYEAASGRLRESLLADPRWRQADEALLYLARSQYKQNQLNDAIATLGSMLKSFPESALLDQANYHLGESYYAAGQFADAGAAYDVVLQQYAKSSFVPYALYGKGWSLMKSGQFDLAATDFSTLIDQHGEHELKDDALFARGMCFRQAKKYAEAIANIDQYLNENPDASQRADALYERGLSEALAEQPQKAADTFSELLKQFPDYPQGDKVLYELAWAYKVLPREAEAIQTFASLAEKYPGSSLAAESHFHVAEDYYNQKEYASAVKAYEQAAKANNPALNEKVVYKLGWSHYQLAQHREALARFEELLTSYSDGELAADAWFMKGECLFRLNDFQQALPAFQEAIQREASSPQVAVLRQLHAAQAAGQLDKWQESVGYLDPLIEQYPESYYVAEAYFERGRARQKLNQLDEAIKDFQTAAEKSRGTVGIRAQFMVGEVEFQQKRYDAAIKDFQRAMFRYGAEEAAAEVRNWQAKAGYEAGRCSEVQIQEATSSATRARYIADAKKFYQYVVASHADTELAAEAQKRLEALAKLAP